MSSEPSCILMSSDLKLLQGVLDEAGYDDKSSLADPELYNIAAKLLIRLFQGGMTDPDELSRELERHFGKSLSARSSASFERSRLSIQGISAASVRAADIVSPV